MLRWMRSPAALLLRMSCVVSSAAVNLTVYFSMSDSAVGCLYQDHRGCVSAAP